jgi:hypothetical protein
MIWLGLSLCRHEDDFGLGDQTMGHVVRSSYGIQLVMLL